MAFEGADLAPVWQELLERVNRDPADSAALLDLSTIAQLKGRREEGLKLQGLALFGRSIYHHPAAFPSANPLRVLAFMAPGDFMANTPLEFLLEGSDISLDVVYLAAGKPFPAEVPDHDVAIVAISESEENRPLLEALSPLLQHWPRPLLNEPSRIARLTRDGVWDLAQSAAGIVMPRSVRASRQSLLDLLGGKRPVPAHTGFESPIILRPVGTHAGHGMSRISGLEALEAYLRQQPGESFYLSPFVDYRSPDGQFRKYRVAVIGGRPFASHMAVSSHWMVHYLNAGMTESSQKRAEEAAFMARFDQDFAVRHAAALDELTRRLGLDYYVLDCAETSDGRLLLFEADVAMIVHSMDPPDLFPYKKPAMQKLFEAFRGLLRRSAKRPFVQAANSPIESFGPPRESENAATHPTRNPRTSA
jgi:hypothetical protein